MPFYGVFFSCITMYVRKVLVYFKETMCPTSYYRLSSSDNNGRGTKNNNIGALKTPPPDKDTDKKIFPKLYSTVPSLIAVIMLEFRCCRGIFLKSVQPMGSLSQNRNTMRPPIS